MMKETERINGYQGSPIGFVEVLPPNFDPKKKYPLLIWFPGLGEVGTGSDADLDRLQGTIVKWLKSVEVNFIVLVGQYRYNGFVSTHFVRWVIKSYPWSSLHMAGLSSGGYVIRDFIIENSDVYKLFSTFTPMATNLDAAAPFAKRIVDNNQYIFGVAGEKDNGANQPGAMARFFKKLQDIDPTRGLFSIIKGIGHSAWEYVYNSKGREAEEIAAATWEGATLFRWGKGDFSWWDYMLAHSKGGEQPEQPEEPEEPTNPEPVKLPVRDAFYDLASSSMVFVFDSGKLSIPGKIV